MEEGLDLKEYLHRHRRASQTDIQGAMRGDFEFGHLKAEGTPIIQLVEGRNHHTSLEAVLGKKVQTIDTTFCFRSELRCSEQSCRY